MKISFNWIPGASVPSQFAISKNMNKRYIPLVLCALFLLSQCAAFLSPALAANSGAIVPKTELTTLRAALKAGSLSFKLKGDGNATAHVELTLNNKTDHALRVLIPANEVLKPNTLAVQTMLTTRDTLLTIPAHASISSDISTVCASLKTIPPPPAEGVEWSVADYPDPEMWKQIAAILEASHNLFQSGAYDSTMFARERKEATIQQLAIWLLLGKKSDKQADQITSKTIFDDILSKMNVTPEQLGPEKLEKFTKGVDEIFAAVDLTLKKAKEPAIANNVVIPSDSTFDTFYKVGQKAIDKGNLTEAEELLTAACDTANSFPANDPKLANSLLALGNCYLYQGKAVEATDFLKKSSEFFAKSGAETAEAGSCFNALGLAYRLQGKYKEAEETLTRALHVREKALGADSTPTAETANNLAIAMVANDQHPEAELAFKRALAIRYKNLGAESPELAETNKNLADLYVKDGKFAQAEKLYKRALQIDQQALGKAHPYLCNILQGLAEAYKGLNKQADADDMSRQAQALADKLLGSASTLIAAVPDNHIASERLAAYGTELSKMDSSVKELQGISGAALAAAGGTGKADANKPVKDKWALVVGISKFQDPDITLKYAAKDAKDFAEYLVKEGNFAPDHVHTLTDEQATRENILAELGDRWLPRVASPDDLVVIFISSHGSPSKADVRGTNYLVAYNTNKASLYATGVPMQDLTKIVKERVHSDRIVMLLDACHSGAVQTAGKGIYRQANFDAEEIVQGTGQLVICSSEPAQTSWESAKYPNGVFTHYLIEGLRKDGNKTSLGSAFQFMKDQVQNEVLHDRGELQTPVLKSRWQGNALLMAAPPVQPRTGQ
jgi:tetratricopeptide (TPR) repeat protein